MLRQSIRLENENLAKNPRIDKRYKASAKLISRWGFGWSKFIACTNYHIISAGSEDKCCRFTLYHHRWPSNCSLEYQIRFGTSKMWNTAYNLTMGIIIICLLYITHKYCRYAYSGGKIFFRESPLYHKVKNKLSKYFTNLHTASRSTLDSQNLSHF